MGCQLAVALADFQLRPSCPCFPSVEIKGKHHIQELVKHSASKSQPTPHWGALGNCSIPLFLQLCGTLRGNLTLPQLCTCWESTAKTAADKRDAEFSATDSVSQRQDYSQVWGQPRSHRKPPYQKQTKNPHHPKSLLFSALSSVPCTHIWWPITTCQLQLLEIWS